MKTEQKLGGCGHKPRNCRSQRQLEEVRRGLL